MSTRTPDPELDAVTGEFVQAGAAFVLIGGRVS